MPRRRFKEWEVIETLIHQGHVIRCFRTKEVITVETVKRLQREHLHEVALGGPDEPANCRYSLDTAHKIVSFGTKATTAGSSIHRIRKADRIANGPKKSKRPMQKRKKYDWPERSFPTRKAS